MDKKNEEIHDNHGKNLPHGQSIADRPVDHQDFAPMMTKAQLAMKSDIKDLGEGHFQVTGELYLSVYFGFFTMMFRLRFVGLAGSPASVIQN